MPGASGAHVAAIRIGLRLVAAEAREEGAKAFEEWDAAIRKNNQDMQKELAARAISHNTRVSDDLRVDVYGMPDGRFVTCKTVLYPQGAPITTCDGAP